jgi:hypothetical protein
MFCPANNLFAAETMISRGKLKRLWQKAAVPLCLPWSSSEITQGWTQAAISCSTSHLTHSCLLEGVWHNLPAQIHCWRHSTCRFSVSIRPGRAPILPAPQWLSQNKHIYIYRNSPTAHTLTLKMEVAMYPPLPPETSPTLPTSTLCSHPELCWHQHLTTVNA